MFRTQHKPFAAPHSLLGRESGNSRRCVQTQAQDRAPLQEGSPCPNSKDPQPQVQICLALSLRGHALSQCRSTPFRSLLQEDPTCRKQPRPTTTAEAVSLRVSGPTAGDAAARRGPCAA